MGIDKYLFESCTSTAPRHCVGRIGKILGGFWKAILTNGWKEVNQPLEKFYPIPETPNTLPFFAQVHRHALSCACW